MFDNVIFRVNGDGVHMLETALELTLLQRRASGFKCWKFSPKHGLILASYGKDFHEFPVPISAEQAAKMVFKWLSSPECKDVPYGDGCEEADIDGDIDEGWEVYCEGWGHVDNEDGAICAIRPACLWVGK